MKTKRLVALLLSLIMLFAVCCGCGAAQTSSKQDSADIKGITIIIQFEDKSEKKLELETDKKYLADVLFEEKLITKEEYDSGYYTVIDGVRADYNMDKAWWCVYENGESAMLGMNELEIEDNDEFKIVHTPS